LAWNVELIDTAKRQLAKLDRKWQAVILDDLDDLEDEIAPLDDPRSRGNPLVGDRKGLWRYRVGDYRILCELQDNDLIVLVVTIGHRCEVYRKPWQCCTGTHGRERAREWGLDY
jgi:mRNA interferase RelE/StbE